MVHWRKKRKAGKRPEMKREPSQEPELLIEQATATFPILRLPTELRMNVFRFIFPSNERIYLDPANFYEPLPYVWTSFGSSKDLLLANKQIHAEAINFIFSNNIINIIRSNDDGVAEAALWTLGTAAHKSLQCVELHVQQCAWNLKVVRSMSGPTPIPVVCRKTHEFHCGLKTLGAQWKVMTMLPNLSHLRLVCYHDYQWHAIWEEFAKHVMSHDNSLVLDMELYTSVWAKWAKPDKDKLQLEASLKRATNNVVYGLCVPRQMRRVTILVSVPASAAKSLLEVKNWQNTSWAFRKRSYQKGPPEMTCITWCKIAPSPQFL